MSEAEALQARRRVTAAHESGHAVVAWRLGRTVEAVSMRPSDHGHFCGLTFHVGGQPVGRLDPSKPSILQAPDFRRDRESGWVVSLAGKAAEMLAGVIWSGYVAEPTCLAQVEREAESLAAMLPRHRDLLMAAESDPEPLEDDLPRVESHVLMVAESHEEAAAYVQWLTIIARRLVGENRWHIQHVADALLNHSVLDGAAFLDIVAPHKESPAMFRKPSDPDPDGKVVHGDFGVPIRLPAELTLSHPHARIATRTFVGRGGLVLEGQLRDDRSQLYKHNTDKFREPTAAERDGHAAAAAKAVEVASAEMRARVADDAAKAAAAASKVAAAALAAAKAETP